MITHAMLKEEMRLQILEENIISKIYEYVTNIPKEFLTSKAVKYKQKLESQKANLKSKTDIDMDEFVNNKDFKRIMHTLQDEIDNTKPVYVKKYILELWEIFKSMFSFKLKNFAPAFVIILIVIFLNTLFYYIVLYTVTPFLITVKTINEIEFISLMITAIFAAPQTEEYAKYVSIKRGFGNEFLFLFNVGEFLLYMRKLGVSIKSIGIRAMAVLMHYITAIIQKYYIVRNLDLLGLRIAKIIHTLWNMFLIPFSLAYAAISGHERGDK